MNKYQSEDYFSVLDKRTGKKIGDCGDEQDALMMVAMDPQNRIYTRNQFLMGQVIDIQMPKILPTNDIVVNMDGGVGGSWEVRTLLPLGSHSHTSAQEEVRKPEPLPQIKLPEGQGKPVRV